jgi:hypothetical protein
MMSWFGMDKVDEWRGREDELQEAEERLRDEHGQDDERARAAYEAIVAHHEDKPLWLWGRS